MNGFVVRQQGDRTARGSMAGYAYACACACTGVCLFLVSLLQLQRFPISLVACYPGCLEGGS